MDNYNSNEKFTDFLHLYAEEVGQRTDAIKGHFRYVQVPGKSSKASDRNRGM